MGNDNEPAKLLLPYLQRADELQKHEHLVAYYCRLYAMERGLKIPVKDRTKTTSALLVSLMNQLEKDRKSLTLGPEDNLYVEGFALNVFAKADKQDRAGRADLNTAKTFYAASIFFEILNQFGEIQPDIEQKQKYAVWKAAEIRKALKEGRRPEPGPPGGDQVLSGSVDLSWEGDSSPEQVRQEKSQAVQPKDSTRSVLDGGTKPEASSQFQENIQHYAAGDNMDPPPAFSGPGYQSTAIHDSHPQAPQDFPEYSQGNLSAYSASYYTIPTVPQDAPGPQIGSAYSYSSSAPSPDSLNASQSYISNYQLYPTMHDGSSDSQPISHGSYPVNASYYQNTNGTHPGTVPYNSNPPSNTEYQSPTQYTSVAGRNGAYGGEQTQLEHTISAPAALFNYDSNYQPPPEKIAEAHKAARFAVGALAFDDVPTAVDYLKRSLELLTLPSTS
eukprot:Gb_39689 [translate_table: standard]